MFHCWQTERNEAKGKKAKLAESQPNEANGEMEKIPHVMRRRNPSLIFRFLYDSGDDNGDEAGHRMNFR